MGSITTRKQLMGKLNELTDAEVALLLRLAEHLQAARRANADYAPEQDPVVIPLLSAPPPGSDFHDH